MHLTRSSWLPFPHIGRNRTCIIALCRECSALSIARTVQGIQNIRPVMLGWTEALCASPSPDDAGSGCWVLLRSRIAGVLRSFYILQAVFSDAACNGRFAESVENIIHLPEDHPKIVELLLPWLYAETIAESWKEKPPHCPKHLAGALSPSPFSTPSSRLPQPKERHELYMTPQSWTPGAELADLYWLSVSLTLSNNDEGIDFEVPEPA